MSKTKFGNLIRSLDVILMANKMSKKAKRPKDMPSVDINTEEHHTGNGNAESACSD